VYYPDRMTCSERHENQIKPTSLIWMQRLREHTRG